MTPKRTDVLIVGAGLAGSRTAEALRALGYDGSVTVVGDERHPPYERPALSKAYLAGTVGESELALRDADFWPARDIELCLGVAVESIDFRARRIMFGGNSIAWRQLVIASGVRSRRLPLLDRYRNVHQLRTLSDASRLSAALRPGTRLAIIGAGFIGLEVASTARALGVDVTVLDIAAVPLAAVLGAEVGDRLAAIAVEAGVDLRLGRAVSAVVGGRHHVDGLLLDDGTRVECDTVVTGIGSLPNTELVAGRLALARDGGIAVDDRGRTMVDGVYACGDVASIIGSGRTEHWSAAATTARSVAHMLLGEAPPAPAPHYFWTEQFGHRLQVIGDLDARWVQPRLEGSEAAFAARYHDIDGRLKAVALLDRPDLLGEARAQLAAGGQQAAAA